MRLGNVILGIKILRTPKDFILNQSHLTRMILALLEHHYSIASICLRIEDNISQVEYSRVIRSLMY